MTLKILGRTPSSLRVTESRTSPGKAREVRFTCSECLRTALVPVPWDATPGQRHDRIRMALDEHRRIGCTVRDAAARRTYKIEYPRG